jgi:hypothetical protein
VEHKRQDEEGERQDRRTSIFALETESEPPQSEGAERRVLDNLNLAQR